MIHLIFLAMALVSLQCGLSVNGQLDSNINLDNNIQTNEERKPKRLRNYLVIAPALPESVRHISGTMTVLECETMGYPGPSVQWEKNGVPVDIDDESNEILSASPTGITSLISKLVITSAQTGDEYTCVATSYGHRKTSSTTVLVEEGDDVLDSMLLSKLFLKRKPIITTYISQLLQTIGSSVVLPCRFYGSPKSKVYWEDNNDRPIYGNSRMRVLPSGDLHITNLKWTDMGNFTCNVKNMHGKDSATTFVYPNKP